MASNATGLWNRRSTALIRISRDPQTHISDKPTAADIYSHPHYAEGTTAFVGGGEGVKIIGQSKLHANINMGAFEK